MATGNKRVRLMPNDGTLVQWLLGEIVEILTFCGLMQHYGQGTQVTTADASDLATSKALAKSLADAFFAHANDATLHPAVDSGMGTLAAAYASTPALPADLTEVQNIANELKTDLNAHIPHTTAHRTRAAQSGGIAAFTLVTTANASDQATSNALLNELKAAFNRHVRLGMGTITVD